MLPAIKVESPSLPKILPIFYHKTKQMQFYDFFYTKMLSHKLGISYAIGQNFHIPSKMRQNIEM